MTLLSALGVAFQQIENYISKWYWTNGECELSGGSGRDVSLLPTASSLTSVLNSWLTITHTDVTTAKGFVVSVSHRLTHIYLDTVPPTDVVW